MNLTVVSSELAMLNLNKFHYWKSWVMNLMILEVV